MICKHGRINNDTLQCGQCWSDKRTIERAKEKQEKRVAKYAFSSKPKTKNDTTNLKTRLQLLWSKKMKELYKEKGYYYDWIDGKGSERTGLFGLHVSHYYPKGEIWQLWTDPVNSGISSYDNNVNNAHTVTMMRGVMIDIWGIDKVNDLDERAELWRKKMSMGIEKRRPDAFQLMAMIQDLKQK
ncbi:MAG: hypothetical protein ABI851_16045 [Saprospiraceae bacterium]